MFNKEFEKRLGAAKKAREKLSHKPGVLVGSLVSYQKGLFLSNYANCLLNRQIDVFDDAILLLENDRIPAACTISRGMIETHAFAKLLSKNVANVLNTKSGKESVEESLAIVEGFLNSSRIKESEQKKISKGVYDPGEYQFTEQAKYRFENLLATSQHVMNALRNLYKEEMKFTGGKESHIEMTYDLLSEWVHPSQTSIFHNYVSDTHNVPTSLEHINIFDNAKLQCATALLFLADGMAVYDFLGALADEISKRDAESS